MNREQINTTLTVFPVAFMPARKIICPAPRDTERLSRIRVRGCHTSLVKQASNKNIAHKQTGKNIQDETETKTKRSNI